MIKQIQPTNANEVLSTVNTLLGIQNPKVMRKHLRQMMDAYFLKVEGGEGAEEFYSTFLELTLSLKRIGSIATSYPPEPQAPTKQPVSAN